MKKFDRNGLKTKIIERFGDRWSGNRKNVIVNDNHYYAVPEPKWNILITEAPAIEYKAEVFDCENIAMEFIQFQARYHLTNWINEIEFPLAIGMASGNFSGVSELHVMNFALVQSESGRLNLRFFDLNIASNPKPGNNRNDAIFLPRKLRDGLEWIII